MCKDIHTSIYIYIYNRERIHRRNKWVNKRKKEKKRMRVYLRSKAATDSPVFTGKFHFLSTNGSFERNEYWIRLLLLRPSSDSIPLLDLSPRNKLYAQNRYSAVVYAYNRVNHFLYHTGRNVYNINLTYFKFIIKILDINTYRMKKILRHD